MEIERKGYFVFCNDRAEESFGGAGSGIGVREDDDGLLDILHARAAGVVEVVHEGPEFGAYGKIDQQVVGAMSCLVLAIVVAADIATVEIDRNALAVGLQMIDQLSEFCQVGLAGRRLRIAEKKVTGEEHAESDKEEYPGIGDQVAGIMAEKDDGNKAQGEEGIGGRAF